MRYFVGTELGIANTIQRHFDWSSNSLWFEEIPNARDPKKMLVVLGGKDVILNAQVGSPSAQVEHSLSPSTARQALSWQSRRSERDLLRPERQPWSTVCCWRPCAFCDHELVKTCMRCFHRSHFLLTYISLVYPVPVRL